MGDEQDSWFKKAFGVDPAEAFQGIQDFGGQVVQGVQQAVSGVAEAAAGAAKKVTGSGSAPTPKPAAPPTSATPAGSFPLSGSVGRGGQNAAGDVKAVQKALGIPADVAEERRFLPARIAGGARFDAKAGEWVGGPSVAELKARGLDPVYMPDSSRSGKLFGEFESRGGGRGVPKAPGATKRNTGMLQLAGQLVLDPAAPTLAGRAGERLVDAAIFAGNVNPVRDVMAGGRWVVESGVHVAEGDILARFRAALAELAA